MIIIERLNAQIQVGNESHAIISSRPRNQNPMFSVTHIRGLYIFDFTGIQIGTVQNIVGQPRQNHFDFYIGMDDLVAHRSAFPSTRATSLGLAATGLRNPVKKVRAGGKAIAWRGALARLNFNEIRISLPPFKISENSEEELLLNIDKEFSQYPIDNGNGRTTREIHFGFQNSLLIRQNKSVRIPRIKVELTPQQYATVLEAIDKAIAFHAGNI